MRFLKPIFLAVLFPLIRATPICGQVIVDIDTSEILATDLYKSGTIKNQDFETTVSFEIIDDWILGMGILSQYNFTIDNHNYRFLLTKRKGQELTSQKDTVFPISIERVDNKLLINKIALCYENKDDTMNLNDEIESINNKMANDFKDNAAFQLWLKEQSTYDIIGVKNLKRVVFKKGKRLALKDCP